MAITPQKKEAPATAEANPKAKRKGKLLLIVASIAGLLILAGTGAVGYLLLATKENADGTAEVAPHRSKTPVFVNLDSFTVNLQPEDGEQYLQAVATLRVLDNGVADSIKLFMPELRHRILLLLSGKKPSEISTPEGRESLSEEIRRQVNAVLNAAAGKPVKTAAVKSIGTTTAKPAPTSGASPNDPVQSVLFTSFIVQ
jgi:flagellar FliL protein